MKRKGKAHKEKIELRMIIIAFVFLLMAYCAKKMPYLDKMRMIMFSFSLIIVGILVLKRMIGLSIKAMKKQRYLRSSLYMIDQMKGNEFEEYLKAHFEKRDI